MKKTEVKDVVVEYLEKKYLNNPQTLIYEIIADQSRETAFWFLCKEVAFEILQKKSKWYYLSFQIDDRKSIVQDEIVKNLPRWIEKKMAVTKNMDSIEIFVNWFISRFINMLKNSTSKKYKIYLKLDVVEYEDEKSFENDMSALEKVILDSFHGYAEEEKKAVLTKVCFDACDDFDFDIGELDYLCMKYDAPPAHSFIDLTHKIKVKTTQDNDGNHQLLIDFEGL